MIFENPVSALIRRHSACWIVMGSVLRLGEVAPA
jgi:hypothetical protein